VTFNSRTSNIQMTLARTEEMERRKAPQVDFVYNSELVAWIIFLRASYSAKAVMFWSP
jgi:hypothetical protein